MNDWVSRSISGDIFFGPAVFSTAAYDQYLPPEILPEMQQDPEIADIYLYRVARSRFRDRYILVIGGSFHRAGQTRRPLVPAGGYPRDHAGGCGSGPGNRE